MLRKKWFVQLIVLSFVFSFYTIGTVHANGDSVLLETKKAASNGHVINSEFGVNSQKGKIKKAYGTPDSEDESILDYYPSRQVAFQLNKNKVEMVYSASKEYQGLTSEDVEKQLGKPHCAEGGFGKAYWSYHLGKYLLTFQFVNEEVKTLQQVLVEKNRTCNELN
ncbi:DUF4309 domain-containing protein [Shimazuella alba]|uniref:DUF4309 domain-containing protein n=1 Tax=Shimazuella alba TaxID=2690964 RepID=A0A6I4VR74_9BACL|nr:DUF4309 domain-containing protein [Shimazuella alba]MXQ52386.1 DUF4309 domain-containing protein [Shimazuella alba]